LVGSDADFGGRKTYFTEHGQMNIVDINSLKAEKRLPKDYREWWGFEDDKLFDFAKEEVEKLYESGEPFNFTMLTADTHFPDGYDCKDCKDKWDNQYANVLSCSSKRVLEFIKWIKEQPFYDNTTIVVCGDHLTMDPEFLKDIDENYTRTVYNCFINAVCVPVKEKNRKFGTFDLFPTTIAALGGKIEGDKLGLGTNLFSNVPTLTEEYGFKTLDAELQKKSQFYTPYKPNPVGSDRAHLHNHWPGKRKSLHHYSQRPCTNGQTSILWPLPTLRMLLMRLHRTSFSENPP